MTQGTDPSADRPSAVHEAADAVAAVVLGAAAGADRPDAGADNHTNADADVAPGDEAEAVRLIGRYLAGPIAALRVDPEPLDPRALPADFRRALDLAGRVAGDGDAAAPAWAAQGDLYARGRAAAAALVDAHWATIVALADRLQVPPPPTAAEVAALIAAAEDLRPAPAVPKLRLPRGLGGRLALLLAASGLFLAALYPHGESYYPEGNWLRGPLWLFKARGPGDRLVGGLVAALLAPAIFAALVRPGRAAAALGLLAALAWVGFGAWLALLAAA